MKKDGFHEYYPAWMASAAVLFVLSVYGLGFYLLSGIGIIFSFLYLAYAVVLEFRVLYFSCRDCYYYNKLCAFGRGVLCGLFFKKGIPGRFKKKKLTWADLLPDLLAFFIPLAGGIVSLFVRFSIPVLFLLFVFILLNSMGNGLIRGEMACKYCRQREIGCPAEKLFDKPRKE